MTAPVTPSQAVLNAARVARSITSPVVVKLGGSAMEEPTATRGTLECVAAMHKLGLKLVLVHGGGKPIDRAMAAAGIEPRKVQGRRYTDDATLEIVVRVLCEINAGLVQNVRQLGVPAEGFHTLYSFPIGGEVLTLDGVDLGSVGRPTTVDASALTGMLLPVVPSLCRAVGGGWLNVNADTAAAAIAGAFPSEHCLFLTDTAGVLRDHRDPTTLFPKLTETECRELIASGVIAGGMIPKVEACFDALKAGAKQAVILDGRRPHALLDWLLGEPGGTTIVPG
ncbi:MAG: acetylglutamate kinase [Fimbriiglobus sp.]|nr:acetylglutamate kinase [Fimbriiglobus sp.]